MELVDGPTLEDRIATLARFRFEEALPISKQIAEALGNRARARDCSSRSQAGATLKFALTVR